MSEPTSPGRWSVGEQDTVVDALGRAVADHPDRVLLDCSGATVTYGEIELRTNRMAHAFAELGVKWGQTVVSILDNHADAVVVWLAINKLGAVSVPLNTALRGEFLRHQVHDAGAALVICERGYFGRLADIADGLHDVRLVLYRGLEDRGAEDATVPRTTLVAAPLDEHRGADESPLHPRPAPADLACLIYTSGTTGPSKGCMISFNYMCNLARQKLRGALMTSDDVLFTPLPLFHFNAVASGITSTMLTGARIAIAPRFSVSRFWPEVERSGATVVSILGSMGILLGQAPDDDAMLRCFGQVHTVRGNPFGADLKRVWQDRFGVPHVGSNDYGLTEAAVVTSLPSGEHVNAPAGSSGRSSPEFDVRIFDDEDRELPPGTPGEIVVRPRQPHVMFEGYWRRPEDTLRLLGNLWLHTGDIGKFDESGYFYFVDRKKDYLRRRGENISSFEMEATFAAHPAVEEVAVHAVLSPVGEDDLKVTAVLKTGALVTEEELCAWAIERVPYYAVPRFVEFRATLPKNPQGRVLKYQLRDEGQTATTWDLEKSSLTVTKR